MIERERIIQIFKASPTPTSIIKADNPRFTFVQVNDAYTKMTQRVPEELIGKSLFEAFPENPDEEKPTGVEKLRNSFQKVIASKQADEIQTTRYDIVLDDGEFKEVYWKVNNTPVFDKSGDVEFIINSATIITDQILSERENKLMLDNTEDSFILINRNLIIQNFNDSFAENYKQIFDIDVKKGDSILDYAQPERREIVKDIYDRVFKGETIEGNLPVEISEGHIRYFNIKYKPAKDENNRIIGSFISLLEKTEEHAAKLELEKNEARFRALVENGNDVLFILSPEAKPTYISPSIKNVLGYSQDEAYEIDLMEMVHPDDVSIIISELAECMDKPGVPIEVTPARMKHKDGRYRWFEGTITNLLHDPAINGIVDNFRDITERVEYQETLAEAKDKYQTLIQTIDGVVWEAEPDKLHVAYMSPQSLPILGHDPDVWASTIGFWRDHIHPDDRKETNAKFERLTKEGQNHELEYRYQKGNGEYIWVRDVVTVITENEKPVIIRGVIIDINKEKELQIELDKVYEMASIGNWEVDLLNEKLYWSNVVKRIFEVDLDFEPDLKTATEFYTENENLDAIHEAVDKAVNEGISFDIELEIITAKGNKKWIRNIGKPEFRGDSCIKIYGSAQDITERKEAQQAKDKERRNKEALINNTNDLIWSVDKQLNLITGNANFLSSVEEQFRDSVKTGYNVLNGLDPKSDNYKKWYGYYERALNGESFRIENSDIVPEDHPKTWFEISFNPIKENDSIEGVACFARNITEIREVQKKSLEAEKKYRNVVEHSTNMFYQHDTEGVLNYVSQQCEDFLGYPPEEAMRNWTDFITDHPINEKGEKHTIKALETGEIQPAYELQLKTADGRIIWVEVNEAPLIQDGKVTGIVGSLSDITERKENNLKLQEALNEKENILESIDDGFFTIDKSWTVTYWNVQAERLLKTPKRKIVGQNLWDVFDDATDNPSYTNYHRAMHQNVSITFEDYYEPIDKWFDISAYPSPEGISVFFKDITDRKKSQQELERLNQELEDRAKELAASNEELEQFAYVASHDLQEPLRMVSSFLTQLDKKYSDQLDEKANQYIHFAVDGAQRMRQIILDLLDYSRLNQDKNIREKVDLNKAISEVISLERSHIEEKEAQVNAQDLPTVMANPAAIKQVFKNLLNNALKYQKQGTKPEIEIGAEELETHWKFTFKDNGIGIAPDFHDNIFQIFQRLHTRDQYSGTGIGLAISKKIIERHGGEIWVESQVDGGSTFYFTINK